PRALVLRDGSEREIDTEHVVPGDILVLREGHGIHADGVVIAAANLAVDESQLTGESEPQRKQARGALLVDGASESAQIFAGSLVLAGHGLGLVGETGPRTRFGRIGRLVAQSRAHATPLQRAIASIVRRFVLAAACVVALVFALEIA